MEPIHNSNLVEDRDKASSSSLDGVLLSQLTARDLASHISIGCISTIDTALRLAVEGSENQILVDDAIQYLIRVNYILGNNEYFGSNHKAALSLKDSLTALLGKWEDILGSWVEYIPPPCVPSNRYFSIMEAVLHLGSYVDFSNRPKATSKFSSGLVRSLYLQYPSHWILVIYWPGNPSAVYFDCDDFALVEKVEHQHAQ